MPRPKLTKAQEQCLRDQIITADQPGSILRDFGMLLDFLRPGPVETAGKYNMLPIKFLGELDARLSRPLNLDLKRPQLRSHPYLQGLNLLLRASGLSRIEGSGAKARMALDPAMMTLWNGLNPTERYFNLLEAWLRLGRPEMVGEQGPSWGGLLLPVLEVWRYLPAKGRKFDLEKPQEIHLVGIYRGFYQLALMDLFGLLVIEQPSRPVTPWSPASVKHSLFGDAVLTVLSAATFGFLLERDSLEVVEEDAEVEPEDEDEEEWEPEVPQFGLWQRLFQPYFPEWRENLKFPEPEFRDGEYVFRVSLGKVWRLIAIPAESTLDELIHLVLRSVKFDSDHLYEFKYRDRMGAETSARHPGMEEGPWADQIKIGTLPLEPGQSMQLMYDFGDNWKFTVKLVRVEQTDAKAKAKDKKPRILETHGEAPPQYPNWDDEE